MKNNTFKRVLAGSLALLTVAAPMSANVGGILQEVAIVASAKTGDNLTLTWNTANNLSVQQYLIGITVGTTTYGASDIKKAVSGFNISGAQGSTAKIVSTVPITGSFGTTSNYKTPQAFWNENKVTYPINGQEAANYNAVKSDATVYKALIANWRKSIETDNHYYDVTDLVKDDDSYKMQPGDFTVTEKNNTWTYDFVVPENEDNNNAVALALAGDRQNVKFAYDHDEKVTDTADFQADVEDEITGEPATAVTAGNQLYPSGGTTYKEHTEIINGTYKITSTKNFTVETNDGKLSNNTQDFDAVFNATTNKYEVEVTIPKYEGDGTVSDATVVTIKQLPEATLTYTVSGNKLIVNGATVAQDTVAASIKASAQRAEVRDENDKVTEEKLDIKDFTTTNGHITYGKNATDGVTIKIEKNANLTTYYGDQNDAAGNNSKYVELTIKKDDAIYGKDAEHTGYDKIAYHWELDGENKDVYTKLTGTDTTVTTDIFGDGLKFHEAGKYAVTAVFYTKRDDGGSDVQTVTYNFEIDPIVLTGDDATIMAQNANGTVKLTEKPIAFTAGKTMELEVPFEKAGEETFTAAVDLAEKLFDSKGNDPAGNDKFEFNGPSNGYVLKQDQKLDGFVKWTGAEAPTNLAAGEFRYAVEGQTTATALDKVNTVTIKIYDQNYGATLVTKGTETYVKPYELKVTYKLVAAAEKPVIDLVDDAEDFDRANKVLVVAQADTDADTFKELFWKNFKGNDFVEKNKSKVSFEYLPAKGKTVDADDLNTRYAGFPTKKNDDGYSLFVCYEGEAFATVDVEIVSVKAKYVPAEDALSMTYGDQIDVDTYTLQDADGNTLSKIKLDDVAIKYIAKAKDKDYSTQAGKKNGVNPYLDPDGKYAKDELVYGSYELDPFTRPNDESQSAWDDAYGDLEDVTLNAGTYIVKYAPKREVGGDYTVSSDEFVLTVAKKQVTADMFYIDAQTYDGKTKKINMNKNCHFVYETETGMKINGTLGALSGATAANLGVNKQFTGYSVTDGQLEAAEAGKYKVSIKLDDKSKTDWAEDLNNFVGTATLTWAVTPSEVDVNKINPKFEWSADDTTLFDAGRIHVQYSKKANNKLGLDKKVTVEQYGVIVDNKGLIAAPDDATLDAASGQPGYADKYEYGKTGTVAAATAAYGAKLYKDAKEKLVFGNGLIEGKASEANQKLNIYGANIKVKDVETGIWARPYMLFSDGTVSYGEPIYVDITREAMKNLQVAFNPEKKLDKTKTNAGYDAAQNKYIAYAKYEKLDATKVQAVVRDFGVVVDNKGMFGVDGVSTSNKKKNVVDDMKLGVDNLIVGHNNKAANAVLAQEEYGAKIKPSNSVTGVWVRAYVKLSDTLVVYSKPEYYETVSQFYSGTNAGELIKGADTTNAKGVQITDLNATAVANGDDTVHNSRVSTTLGLADVNGENVVATPVLYNADIKYDNTNRMYTAEFVNTVLKSNKNYEFVAMGMVVDKDEKLVKRETVGAETQFKLVDDADKKLILGNGFIDGVKNDGTKEKYTARIEPNGNKIIAARPYVTFKKDGNLVTVYGDIVMNNCGTAAAEYKG